MSNKPIFVATHPRACSTAFERVFMTRRDSLSCVHEPFGDAWYFGPERLSDRFENDKAARVNSGYSNTTYDNIFDAIDQQQKDTGKRLFIKDMAQYWMPRTNQPDPAVIAPSLVHYKRGVGTNGVETNGVNGTHSNGVNDANGTNGVNGTNGAHANGTNGTANGTVTEQNNPTVVPDNLLRHYHFTFLIRHPRSSVPSYFRCTVPPLSDMTGFNYFDPIEMGYKELRKLFDYLVAEGHIGPKFAGSAAERTHGPYAEAGEEVNKERKEKGSVDICVVDADDLLDDPYGVIEAYCKSTGLEYDPGMLNNWDAPEVLADAKRAFEKWKGFHEDALGSKELKPRCEKHVPKPDAEILKDWQKKYGEEAAELMMKTVKDNMEDYEYLKQFALKV